MIDLAEAILLACDRLHPQYDRQIILLLLLLRQRLNQAHHHLNVLVDQFDLLPRLLHVKFRFDDQVFCLTNFLNKMASENE